MTSRRGFLALLSGASAAFALDPERALWVPGAKTFSFPARRVEPLTLDEMQARYFEPAAQAFHDAMLLDYKVRMMFFKVAAL